jgi:hypothetical protein
MTSAAITALDGSDDGFFLMVEGSAVDSGGHGNNLVNVVSEYLAFDEAFKVALDYAKGRTDTVILVAPDHDTGGLNLPGKDAVGGSVNSSGYADAVAEVRAGINSSKNGITWETGGHTNRRCGVWMYAPNGVIPPQGLSDTPGDNQTNRGLIIDNTEIAPYLAGLMGLDLQEATDELFVDVTDLGIYNANNRTFTFNDADVSIKANQSFATVAGEMFPLNGQIAVYSKGRFYAPKSLVREVSYGEGEQALQVKTVRFHDISTGKTLVKGQLDKAFAGSQVSLLLWKKGVDRKVENVLENVIGYIDQTTVNKDGSYVFKFSFVGNVDEYDLFMYLGDELVTDSITVATADYSWLDAVVLLSQGNDGLVSGILEINNYYNLEGLTYTVALASYDENDKLISIYLVNDAKTIGNEITIDDFSASIPEDAVIVKALVWSSYTQMIPIYKNHMEITQ